METNPIHLPNPIPSRQRFEERRSLNRLFLFTVFAVLVLAQSCAIAGEVEDIGFVARATVGKSCTEDDAVVPGPIVNGGQFTACNTITAENIEVTCDLGCARRGAYKSVTFTTGGSIHLGKGFSVGQLEYGSRFVAEVDPLVASPFAYLTDGSPNDESIYHAVFDMDLTGLNLIVGEGIGHFNGYSPDNTLQFQLVLHHDGSQHLLELRVNDSGTMTNQFVALDSITNKIQIMWKAGNGDGEFKVSINDGPFTGMMGLNNAASRIDYVRWGLVDGNLISTTGYIDLDNFFSWH